MSRRALTYCAITVAAMATGAWVPTGGAAVANCTTSGLVIWLDTEGNATAGSFYYTLKFTNQSGHTCRLIGYPGVSALDLHGPTTHVVKLTNGSTAGAVLRITAAANYPESACHRVAAAGLRVYPPNQTASKVVPLPFEACAHAGPVYLSVETVGL